MQHDCDHNITRRLIGQGADLDQQDVVGRTPLHHFFTMSTQALIQYHQDDIGCTIEDARGVTAAHLVARSKSSRLADLLPCLEGVPADSTDRQGRTILHLALKRGNLEITRYLLDLPISTAFKADWQGLTLLHYAVLSRRTQTIDMLLDRGHDLHATDCNGRTVLHYAAMNGKLEAVRKLLRLGAESDLVAVNHDLRTPIQLAAFSGAEAVVQYLRPLCALQKLDTPDTGQVCKSSKWLSLWSKGQGLAVLTSQIVFLVIFGFYFLRSFLQAIVARARTA